jgi:membrane protein YdbS with pleckstrin-like domain
MICPQCGVEVVAEAIFCHKCGHPIAQQVSQTDDIQQRTDAPAASAIDKFKAAASQLDASNQPEQELWIGGFSPKAMFGTWFLGVLVSIVLLIIGALWVRSGWLWIILLAFIIGYWAIGLMILIYRRLSVRYQLTNQKFIHESGILRRVTDRIEVIDIDDITFEQGLIERLVGVGTIKITSSDRTHPELLLYGIENVGQVSEMLDDIRRAERRRRGLHIENI